MPTKRIKLKQERIDMRFHLVNVRNSIPTYADSEFNFELAMNTLRALYKEDLHERLGELVRKANQKELALMSPEDIFMYTTPNDGYAIC